MYERSVNEREDSGGLVEDSEDLDSLMRSRGLLMIAKIKTV